MADGDITKEQLDLDVQKFLAGLKAAQDGLSKFSEATVQAGKRMADGFNPLNSAIKNIESQLRGLMAPLATLGSISGFMSMVKSAGQAAESIQQLGQQLGLNSGQIQGYEVLLSRVGLSTDSLVTMFRTLSRALVEAKDPASDAASRFRALGVSQDVIRSGNIDAIIRQIANGMSQMSDKARGGELATHLLGRSALQLIPAFAGGAKAIDEARTSSKLFGEINERQITILADMDDKIKDVGTAFKRWGQNISAELAPAISDLSDSIMSIVKSLTVLAGESGIAWLATKAFNAIAFSIGTLADFLKDVASLLVYVKDVIASIAGGNDLTAANDKVIKALADTERSMKNRGAKLLGIGSIDEGQTQGPEFQATRPPSTDEAERKRYWDHEVTMAEQAYKAQELLDVSYKAKQDAYFHWIDQQRKRDLELHGQTGKLQAEILGKYKLMEVEFVKKAASERLKTDIDAYTKWGEELKQKEQEHLTNLQQQATAEIEIRKAAGDTRAEILSLTLAQIKEKENAELFAIRNTTGEEDKAERIRRQADAERVKAHLEFNKDYLESDKKLQEETYNTAVSSGKGFEAERAAYLNKLIADQAVELVAVKGNEEATLEIRMRYARLWNEFNTKNQKEQLDLLIAGATAQFEQERALLQRQTSQRQELAQAEVQAGVDEFASLEELSQKRITLLKAERDAKLAALQPGVDNTTAIAAIDRSYNSKLNREILEGQGDTIQGLKRGWYTYMTDLGNTFNYAVDFARSTAQGMQQSFKQLFFDAFTGETLTLKSVLTGFKNFFMNVLTELAAKLLTVFIMKQALGLVTAGASAGAGSSDSIGGLAGSSGNVGGFELRGRTGGHVGRYRFGGPAFLDEDRYPALLRRGEFVLNPTGVDTLSKINQGNNPLAGNGNINVNIVDSGRKDKPQVNMRRQMEELVVDIIFKNVGANGQLRGLGIG